VLLTDVTTQVVDRLNRNLPFGDGVNEPNRFPRVALMFRQADQKWVDAIGVLKTPFSTIKTRPLTPGRDELFLERGPAGVDTDFESFVLQADGPSQGPALFAVSYPKSLGNQVDPRTGKLPFVVAFYAKLRQNIEQRFGGLFVPDPKAKNQDRRLGHFIGYPVLSMTPQNALAPAQRADESLFHPFGWDYLFSQLWAKLNYRDNPMLSPNFHGFPCQIHASGKKAVLVVPLLSRDAGAGAFSDPAKMLATLGAIGDWIVGQRFKQTLEAAFEPRSVALAAFSSGCALLKDVLANLRVASAVHEVYLFDPPADISDEVVEAAVQWTSRNTAPGIVRVYSNRVYPALNKVTPCLPQQSPQAQSSADGRRTVVIMTEKNWRLLFGSHIKADWSPALRDLNNIPAALNDPQDIGAVFLKINPNASLHQYMPALMLTDALRRSGF
jgi:hypothetical protein